MLVEISHCVSNGYPNNWETRRKNIYKRDDHKCQNCGVSGGESRHIELHAHHIVPKSRGGSHQKSNLITLCKDCHNAVHGDITAPTGIVQDDGPAKVGEVERLSDREWTETVARELKDNEAAHKEMNMHGLNNCVLCRSSNSIAMVNPEPLNTLAMCTECATLVRKEEMSWEVIYSKYNAEGLSLTSEIWEKAFDDGVSELPRLYKYQDVSESQQKRSKYIIFGGTILGGLLISPFLLSGKIVLSIFLLILLALFLVASDRLNKVMSKKVFK